MKLINDQGEAVCSLAISTDGSVAQTHLSYGDGAVELDLPKFDVSFENTKEGLLVHVGLNGTDKRGDVLVEYDDVKALRALPGKGLVPFALKAFR